VLRAIGAWAGIMQLKLVAWPRQNDVFSAQSIARMHHFMFVAIAIQSERKSYVVDDAGAPQFVKRPKDQRVVEGNAAFFSCDVTSEPPLPHIHWNKDGKRTAFIHLNKLKLTFENSTQQICLHLAQKTTL